MTLLSPTSLLLIGLVVPEFILFLRFSRARKLTVPSVYLWKRMKPGKPRLGWRKISRVLEFVLLAAGTALLGFGLAMPVPEGETLPVVFFAAAAPETHDSKYLATIKDELASAIASVPRHRAVAVVLPDGSVVGPSESRTEVLSAIRNMEAVHKNRSSTGVYSTAARYGEAVEVGAHYSANSYGIIGVDTVSGKLAALVYNYRDSDIAATIIFRSEAGSVSVENRRLNPRLNVVEFPEVDTTNRWTMSLSPGDGYAPDDRFYIQPLPSADIRISVVVKIERLEFLKTALDAIAKSGLSLVPGTIFSYSADDEADSYIANADFQDSIIVTDIRTLERLNSGTKIIWLKFGGSDELRLTPQDKIRVGESYIHTAYAGPMRVISCVEPIATVRDTPVAGLDVAGGKIVAAFGFDASSRGFLISPAFPILLHEALSKIKDWEPVEPGLICGEPFRAKRDLKLDYARMISPARESMRVVNGEVFTPDAPGIYELSVEGYKMTKCVNVCSHPEFRARAPRINEPGMQIYDMCAYAGIGLLTLEALVFLLRGVFKVRA